MKRCPLLPRVLSLTLCLVLLTGLLAIPAGANYTIYVNAKDGVGLNLRSGPGTEYSKVRSNPIPMYTALTISQTETSAAGNSWGYTSYEGTSGWVCLVETTTYDPRPSQPPAAAYTAADYHIYVNAKDGLGLNLRSGPGTEYSKVRSNPIPMYTRLHIVQTAYSQANLLWGYTSYNGTSGWVCLVETTTYDPTPKQTETVQPETPPVQEDDTPAVPDQTAPTVKPAPTAGEDGSALTTMALGIIIGLLAAILILLVVLAVRKKKNN
ncbi:MAG: hypothetical protein Q4C76_07565 [Bacillota bacterium]|nr:hypothetical protein [Bacillota bacterium]